MTKLEEKLQELGYKKHRKSDYMCAMYFLTFEHTAIEIGIGSPLYPEFDYIRIGLPKILMEREVWDEINKVYEIAVEHQKLLKENGLELFYDLGGLEND